MPSGVYVRQNKYSTEYVISQFKKIWGDKYSYEKFVYVDNHELSIITCKEHGDFKCTPANHKGGRGCRKCRDKKFREDRVLTLEEFIERCYKKYGDKVDDYSLVNYVDTTTEVILKCHMCGKIFKRTPNAYLSKVARSGCKKCNGKHNYTVSEYVKIAIKKWGDTFDYSQTFYKNMKIPISIICKKCGDLFEIIPNNHLKYGGCCLKRKSRLEENVLIFLSAHNIKYKQGYKRFNWLRNDSTNYRLELDFYLPDYNIAIECQGEQHFIPFDFFGGERSFVERQERDRIKKKLCEEHNLPLYYINYNDNVEEKLNDILKILM